MNIIIIVADDLGWGDVGFHGSNIETPNIDALAASGMILDQFYGQSLCSPTRSAILTGRYPFRYGLQKIIWPWNTDGLCLSEKLLPQFFKDAGYETYMVGKWNLGHNKRKYTPQKRGFNYYYGCYTGSVDYWNHKYFGVHDLNENGLPMYHQGHMTDLFKEKAIELISNHDKNKNFLMYLTFTAPHMPLEPLERFFNKYEHIKDPMKRKFAALVSHLDEAIGQIVSELKNQSILDDTLIWFTSDNGGNTNCGANNGKLRGGKIEYYEGGIRLVSFINHKGLNGISKQVIHAIDILPTLLEFAGIPIPEDLDGISVKENIVLNKIIDRKIIHHLVYGENILDLGKLKYTYNNKKNEFVGAVRSGDWKLIKYETTELFNIKEDPFEETNLVEVNPNKRDELLNELSNNLCDYVDEPKRWTEPTGYPPDYILPAFWGKNNFKGHL